MSSSLEALVNRQIRRWELVRRSSVGERPLPSLAISRPLGAGAAEIGRQVGEQFGYPVFDRQIVEWIAQETGRQEQLISGLDEHIRDAIDRLVSDGFTRARFSEGDYLHQLVRILAALSERGGAVILGRGAQFVLPPAQTLRVLVVAPQSVRVERLHKSNSISMGEAEELIRQSDADRRHFLAYHFHREWDDPNDYDLCVNTGLYSLDAAARLLIAAYRARFPWVKPLAHVSH
jgi:cytidylate kinase